MRRPLVQIPAPFALSAILCFAPAAALSAQQEPPEAGAEPREARPAVQQELREPAAPAPAPGTFFVYPERVPLSGSELATAQRGLLCSRP